jgi:hypothetical protein
MCALLSSSTIAQDNDPVNEGDELYLVGKTFTIEEDGEEITFVFREDGEVFISGSEFDDGVTGSYEQEEEDVIITIGDEKIFAFFDGEEFEIEEPEYYPPGYNITAVGVDAYEARVYTSSEGDTIQYRRAILSSTDCSSLKIITTKLSILLFSSIMARGE